MCGRYAIDTRADDWLASFGLAASFNVAPSTLVPVMTKTQPTTTAHWGWMLGDKLQINARSETLREKISFRDHLKEGRCLMPASAFYEWQQKGERQPYLVRLTQPFAFAGLIRQQGGGQKSLVITTSANEKLRPIHHREPVMLQAHAWQDWLNAPLNEALELLQPADPAQVVVQPVSRAVNRVANNDPALMARTEIEPLPQGRFTF